MPIVTVPRSTAPKTNGLASSKYAKPAPAGGIMSSNYANASSNAKDATEAQSIHPFSRQNGPKFTKGQKKKLRAKAKKTDDPTPNGLEEPSSFTPAEVAAKTVSYGPALSSVSSSPSSETQTQTQIQTQPPSPEPSTSSSSSPSTTSKSSNSNNDEPTKLAVLPNNKFYFFPQGRKDPAWKEHAVLQAPYPGVKFHPTATGRHSKAWAEIFKWEGEGEGNERRRREAGW